MDQNKKVKLVVEKFLYFQDLFWKQPIGHEQENFVCGKMQGLKMACELLGVEFKENSETKKLEVKA
jgi:hypothetical protein